MELGMAEHLGQKRPPSMDQFSYMGKPLGTVARQAGYEALKDMGLDSPRAMECNQAVCQQLERDKPYEAQAEGMKHIDLTGWYRLVAVILTAEMNAQIKAHEASLVEGAFI